MAGVVVHGNVDISSALMRELLWRRVVVAWCSGRGRVVGWASSSDSPNGAARVHQCALSEKGLLPVALDLMEEFRTPVAESTVIRAI